ncbi:MAG: phospholipid carrier-dependent glycosyltransferase, partial [Victivallaceae bacterium]
MYECMKFKRRFSYLIFAIIFLFALFIRLYGLRRGWIYDEIWGLTSWMQWSNWGILNMLDYQNNHPLNTVFMKYGNMFFGLNYFAIRFHDFIGGVLLVPAVYMLTIALVKNRWIALLSAAFVATHGGLIYYSEVARGYSLETFLV